MPAAEDTCEIADSVRLSHAPLGQLAARRLSILGVLLLTPPCGRSNAALAARRDDDCRLPGSWCRGT